MSQVGPVWTTSGPGLCCPVVVPLTGFVSACSADVNSCDAVAGAVDGRLYHTTWSNRGH